LHEDQRRLRDCHVRQRAGHEPAALDRFHHGRAGLGLGHRASPCRVSRRRRCRSGYKVRNDKRRRSRTALFGPT
jgi:hypothetical protein